MKLYEKERLKLLKEIEKNKKITHCYIKKGLYYRPDHRGYTSSLSDAGIYTKEDALKSARRCDELDLIPTNIHDHNAMIVAKITELSTRLITTT